MTSFKASIVHLVQNPEQKSNKIIAQPFQLALLLKKSFDLAAFSSGQEQKISQLLSGQSYLAISPTGSGKSLC